MASLADKIDAAAEDLCAKYENAAYEAARWERNCLEEIEKAETLLAERDQTKWELDQIAERRWYEIFHREMVRADNAQQALGAVKAWLQQEEEVGLGVPDILWDTILGAMSDG